MVFASYIDACILIILGVLILVFPRFLRFFAGIFCIFQGLVLLYQSGIFLAS